MAKQQAEMAGMKIAGAEESDLEKEREFLDKMEAAAKDAKAMLEKLHGVRKIFAQGLEDLKALQEKMLETLERFDSGTKQ